jgi:hypothetical protein
MASRAADMAEMTVTFFNGARTEPELSDRMSFAQTIVHIHFVDADDEAVCTVWLDRSPICAEMGAVGQPEVEMFGPSKAWMGMVVGDVELAMAIARGEVTYRGPVRKFLRVVPILRSFDFTAFRSRLAQR